MPQTRSGRQVGAASNSGCPKTSQPESVPEPDENGVASKQTLAPQAPKKNAKRKSLADEEASHEDKENTNPNTSHANKKPKAQPEKRAKHQNAESKAKPQAKSQAATNPSGKPRLTTPDLEFDWDRSQLRDPRPTPGRKARPRYREFDLEQRSDVFYGPRNVENREVAAHFENDFYVPKPEKPKGRLNCMQKDEMYREATMLDPRRSHHDMYVCQAKGRNGSPTYDSAGFQLDWAKVNECLKPKAYNKKSIMNIMDKALERGAAVRKGITEIFYEQGHAPGNDDESRDHLDFARDQISKDLGVPWHMVGVEEAKTWQEKGFKPVKFQEWWKKPNDVEKKRMSKMHEGCVYRVGKAKV